MVLDQREDRINKGYFAVDMTGYNPRKPGSTRWVDYPASYHNNAGGVTLADGHSVIKKWIDPRTSVPIRKGINIPVFVTSPGTRMSSDFRNAPPRLSALADNLV